MSVLPIGGGIYATSSGFYSFYLLHKAYLCKFTFEVMHKWN